MLIVLIPIAWLTIIAIVVNACRAAARGDELLASAEAFEPRPLGVRAQGQENSRPGAQRQHLPAGVSRSSGGRSRGPHCAA